MEHKACRRMAPVLRAREMASRNLHTAEVTGSIPVAPTIQGPSVCLGFCVFGGLARMAWDTRRTRIGRVLVTLLS
jgi:hypothetical protein